MLLDTIEKILNQLDPFCAFLSLITFLFPCLLSQLGYLCFLKFYELLESLSSLDIQILIIFILILIQIRVHLLLVQ